VPSFYAVRPRPRVPKRGRHTFLRSPPPYLLLTADLVTATSNVETASLYLNPAGGETGGIELVSVDKFGNRYGTIAGAVLRSCGGVKNGIGTARVTFNTQDPDYGDQLVRTLPDILEREVQVWRHGRLFWWGRPIRAESNAETVDIQLAEPHWPFTRRFFGRATRANLIADGSFEDLASTDWTAVDTAFTRTTSKRQIGVRSAQLVQSAFDPATGYGPDAYLLQRIDNYQATGVGTLLTLAAWFYIDDGSWLGPAFFRRGLEIRRFASDGVSDPDDSASVAGIFEIDGNTRRGLWQRAETAVSMPIPDSINDLEIRLYSPGGTIYWDAVTLTIMESLSSAEGPNDFEMEQTKIFRRIVEHAQDPAAGKDDLNITTNTPPSGVERTRVYQYADHEAIWQAMLEFPNLSNGFDFTLDYPDPHTRVLTTHYPRVGSYKPEFALEAGKNIVAFRLSLDGEQVANNVTILSVDSEGPDREEGGATDTSEYDIDLELVQAAPSGAPIDSLVERAEELLATHRRPEVLEVTVVEDLDGAPIGEAERFRRIVEGLRPGDTTDVRLPVGWVQLDGVYEVVRWEYQGESGAIVFTMNRSVS